MTWHVKYCSYDIEGKREVRITEYVCVLDTFVIVQSYTAALFMFAVTSYLE